MRLIQRMKKFCDSVGLGAIGRRAYAALRVLPENLLLYPFRRARYARQLNEMGFGSRKRLIYWPGSYGWKVALFQRPQQMARALARQGCLVIYESTVRVDAGLEGFCRVEDGLWLVNRANWTACAMLQAAVRRSGIRRYLQVYSTQVEASLSCIRRFERMGYRWFYEYVDRFDPQISAGARVPVELERVYRYVLAHREIPVAATSRALLEDVVRARGAGRAACVTNGVTLEDFASHAGRARSGARKRVLYYGAIAHWMDYDLLKYAADAMPDVEFVLIGHLYDDSFAASGVSEKPNVRYLGVLPYEELAETAADCDVFTIPFVKSPLTDAVSPLKLFEYMALGQPIVTTALEECMYYKSAIIAGSAEEYVQCVRRAIRMNAESDREYFEILRAEAQANTWDCKAAQLISLLEEAKEK